LVAAPRSKLVETRIPEIRLLSEIIDIGFKMNFPTFSNDGEYLKILFAEDILNNLGSPSDDYHNYFTARMLLLLEGRPVYGEIIYRRLLKSIVDSYFRDYPHHPDDFRPTFLVNDILRFWKTLCLNYEHKRNEETSRSKTKHKIKNFKLGFSRLLICFATVASLGTFRRNVTPSNVLRICRMTPVQRLIFAANTSSDARLKVAAVKSTANDDSAARGRLKSRGPGAAMLASKGSSESSLRSRRWRKIVASRTVAKEPVHRGERGPGRSNHCVRNAGCLRRDRGDYARVLFYFAHGAADALEHPAFRAPSFGGGGNEDFGRPRAVITTGAMTHVLDMLSFARTGQTRARTV
jgi:hypothetical protein